MAQIKTARRNANDRRVQKYIDAAKAGAPLGEELMDICPFRTLLFGAGRRAPPGVKWVDPTAMVAVLGWEPEDFSWEMRADILQELACGGIVLLVSNNETLRDHAKREVLLAFAAPSGSA